MPKCGKGQIWFHDPVNRCVPKNKPFISKIKVKHEPDTTPDLSWLETEYDEDEHEIIKSVRYDQKAIKKYGWGKVKKWMDSDKERLESYGNSWEMMGIIAEAEIYIPHKGYQPPSWQIQKITSGGLWGIETDSDKSYIKSVEEGQIDELKDNLKALGISEREFQKALREGIERD